MNDMFIMATRKRLRFDTKKGSLTVEDLWASSLEDLDALYSKLATEFESIKGNSLLVKKQNTVKDLIQLKMDIVKYIVEVLLDEKAARENAAINAQKAAQISEIINRKDQEELNNLTKEELLKKLQNLK